MPTLDYSYIKRFRGVLGWNGYTDGTGKVVPSIEVELYINSYPTPVRKPKINEMVSVPQLEPGSGLQIGTAALFYGTPDPLQVELSGWIITFQSSRKWVIKDTSGATLDHAVWGNIPYAEVISTFLHGDVNRSAGGAPQCKHPDYYISPQGYEYIKPIIASYQPQATPNVKKQAFQMVLILES